MGFYLDRWPRSRAKPPSGAIKLSTPSGCQSFVRPHPDAAAEPARARTPQVILVLFRSVRRVFLRCKMRLLIVRRRPTTRPQGGYDSTDGPADERKAKRPSGRAKEPSPSVTGIARSRGRAAQGGRERARRAQVRARSRQAAYFRARRKPQRRCAPHRLGH